MFEKATRIKIRFPWRGQVSVEDLWELTPNELDGIYKKLSKEATEASGDSLMKVNTSESEALTLKIDILKHIVSTKISEANAKENAILRKQKKDKIIGILADKEDQELFDKSPEELRSLVDQL